MTGGDPAAEMETVARRWFEELFNRGDLEVADEIVASNLEYHGPTSLSPAEVRGPEDVKEYVELYRTAFPDLLYSIEGMSHGDGEVRVRWSATGTHQSDLFAIEPTGEPFTIEGIDVFVIEEGVITEAYAQWDTLKLVQELGVVPEF